jgi:putative ABC transport system permease protein
MHSVTVYGLDDLTLYGAPPRMVVGSVADLSQPRSIILDVAGFRKYFPDQPLRTGDTIEVGGKRVRIVGLCYTDITGMIYTKLSNALSLEGQTGMMATYFLVKACEGTDPETLASKIVHLTGLIVGIVIVGQTFYMFICDNLKQFAAVKAIGIGNGTILSM